MPPATGVPTPGASLGSSGVQIDRDSVAGGAGARDADRVVEHSVDAALFDFRHREDLHAELGRRAASSDS